MWIKFETIKKGPRTILFVDSGPNDFAEINQRCTGLRRGLPSGGKTSLTIWTTLAQNAGQTHGDISSKHRRVREKEYALREVTMGGYGYQTGKTQPLKPLLGGRRGSGGGRNPLIFIKYNNKNVN